jgi:hypothetical protein
MSIPRVSVADWANLPTDIEETSLWRSVHDGNLQSIKSDLLARTLTVRFEVPYLRSFHSLPDDLGFAFVLQGVQSVRALRMTVWPGEFSLPSALNWEEHQERMAEYRKLWRQESESWNTFESAANSDEDAELTDGDIVSADGVVTLRLGVQMTSGEWYEVFMRSETLTTTRTDQQEFALMELLSFGHLYWEAFAKRGAELQR